jgi:predicted transcriptional regulator
MKQAKYSIDDELRGRLRELAAREQRSESAIVRRAVRAELDRADAEWRRVVVTVGEGQAA